MLTIEEQFLKYYLQMEIGSIELCFLTIERSILRIKERAQVYNEENNFNVILAFSSILWSLLK